MPPRWNARRIGFVAIAGLLSLLGIADLISHLITDSVAPHRIHSIGHAAATGLLVLGVIPQLRWPTRAVAGVYLVLAVGVGGMIGNLISGRFSPFPLVFLVFGGVLAVLHPLRAEIVRPKIDLHVPLLLLTILTAIPLVAYALGQAGLQRDDMLSEHGAQGHWGLMASVPLMVILVGFVAATRMSGWRLGSGAIAVILLAMGVGSLLVSDPSRFVSFWAVVSIVAGAAFAFTMIGARKRAPVTLAA